MTDQERMTNILSDMMQVNDPICLKTIQQAAKDRKDAMLVAKTLSWQVGDEVQLLVEHQGRKPYNTIGKIAKINKVRFKVNFPNFGVYTVPKTMLMKA